MKNMAGGFMRTYMVLLISVIFVVFGAYFIGKRIPTNEIEITDHIADRYESAGLEKPLNQTDPFDPYSQRNGDEVANYGVTLEPSGGDRPDSLYRYIDLPAQNSSDQDDNVQENDENSADSISSSQPAPQSTTSNNTSTNTTGTPNNTFNSAVATFKSKTNDRISFQYPADAKVKETKKDNTIIFTITDKNNRAISMTYDKVSSGCFDPIRSFSINPDSIIDYRIIYPPRDFVVEEKYQALRSDEEIGSYIFAGNDPARPLIFASNVCAQTAVPTRVRISSTQYKAGDKDMLAGIYDLILSKISL